MSKQKIALFIKKYSKESKLGWYGFRGLFNSQQAAEANIAVLANKNNNLAEIVDFNTLKILKILKKDSNNEWK